MFSLNSYPYKILSTFGFLFAILLQAVFLRIFFFEIYSIPSGMVEEMLVPGDRTLCLRHV